MALTTLASFRDPWEAHMFRALLESEGIPAIVADDQFITMNWPISTALGGSRVKVPDDQAESAKAVLIRCAEGLYQSELSELFGGLEENACPKCGSKDFRRRPSFQQLLFGLICLYVATAVKVEAKRCRCRKCGTRWRE